MPGTERVLRRRAFRIVSFELIEVAFLSMVFLR
jgi:hypothetical protein